MMAFCDTAEAAAFADKGRLRRELLERRAAMSVAARQSANVRLCDRLRDLPEYRAARAVGLYLAIGAEVDLDPIRRDAQARGVRVCVPAIGADRVYRFVDLAPETPLVRGPLGVKQPADAAPVPTAALDLVLAPGLGFDAHGGRLGHGGGHYDRMLAAAPAVFKCGVAFEVQLAERLPMGPRDVRMDAVITEDRCLRAAAGVADGRSA